MQQPEHKQDDNKTHLQRVPCKVQVPLIQSTLKIASRSRTRTSTDDVIESDEDESTWLISTSSSSSGTDHSLTSDDDENDVESIPNDSDSDNQFDRYEFDESSVLWKNDDNQQFHRRQQHQSQHGKCNNPTTAISSSQQQQQQQQKLELPQTKKHFYGTIKTTIHGYLTFYADFTAKAKHQEILLKVLQWSLWLIGACLLSTTTSFTNNNNNNNTTNLLPQWMQKLSYDVCYARYVTRLLGLPVALEGAMSGSWATSCYKNNKKNQRLETLYQRIGLLLAYSMVAYYPVEHVAFFLWMNPNAETILNMPAETWFYISMRCWLLYLIVETVQCVIKCNELQHYKNMMQQSKKTDRKERTRSCGVVVVTLVDDNDDDDSNTTDEAYTPAELNGEIYNVLLLFIRNLFYIAPCINWSMSTWDTQPLLSDIALNGLMWLESILCLYQAIYNAT
jgi:Peroxisomal biogenesis factor 11 (PEX11)